MKKVFYEFVRRISTELKAAIGTDKAEGAAESLDDEKIKRLEHIIEHVLDRVPHKTATGKVDPVEKQLKSMPNEILRQIMNMLKFSIFPGNRSLFDQRLSDVFTFLDRLLVSEMFGFEELSLLLLSVRARAMSIRNSQYSFARSCLLRPPQTIKNLSPRRGPRNATAHPALPSGLARASKSSKCDALQTGTASAGPAAVRTPQHNLPPRRHASNTVPRSEAASLGDHNGRIASKPVSTRTRRRAAPPVARAAARSTKVGGMFIRPQKCKDNFVHPQLRIQTPVLSDPNESDGDVEKTRPMSTRMVVPASLTGKTIVPNFLLTIPVTRHEEDDADSDKVEVLTKTPSLQDLLDSIKYAERRAGMDNIVLDAVKCAGRRAEMDSVVLDSMKCASRRADIENIVPDESCFRNKSSDACSAKERGNCVNIPHHILASS